MSQFVFRVAEKFPAVPDDFQSAHDVLKSFSELDIQGDGYKSFVGVVLGILSSEDRIVLIDEPEAFLHPTQAKFLGKWIAKLVKDLEVQVILATHNSNLLDGILSKDESIDIFRVNRNGDITSLNQISADITKKLSKEPLLSSQPILESIFYKGVIVCEADSDRCIYQTVAEKELNNEEILFVHSHNKQTLKNVVSILEPATIPVAAVVDFDIINEEKTLQELLESFNKKLDMQSRL